MMEEEELKEMARKYRIAMHERDERIVAAAQRIPDIKKAALRLLHTLEELWIGGINDRATVEAMDALRAALAAPAADPAPHYHREAQEELCGLLEHAAEFAFRNCIAADAFQFFAGQRQQEAYSRLSLTCQHNAQGSRRVCLLCDEPLTKAEPSP